MCILQPKSTFQSESWLLVKGRFKKRKPSLHWDLRFVKERPCLEWLTSSLLSTILSSMSPICLAGLDGYASCFKYLLSKLLSFLEKHWLVWLVAWKSRLTAMKLHHTQLCWLLRYCALKYLIPVNIIHSLKGIQLVFNNFEVSPHQS